jgi:hypothetical protein
MCPVPNAGPCTVTVGLSGVLARLAPGQSRTISTNRFCGLHAGAGEHEPVGLSKAADGDGIRWHAVAN